MVELEKDDGGPAFPTGDDPNSKLYANYGISARDYFAAKAPISLVDAMQAYGMDVTTTSFADLSTSRRIEILDLLAEMRVMYADSMLRARAK